MHSVCFFWQLSFYCLSLNFVIHEWAHSTIEESRFLSERNKRNMFLGPIIFTVYHTAVLLSVMRLFSLAEVIV